MLSLTGITMMMWRARIPMFGAAVLVMVPAAALTLNNEGAAAAPLLQVVTDTPAPPTDTPIPPTDTPAGPTNTPFPTDTPQPSQTPIGPTPPVNTPTPAPPARTPRPGVGGGGGVPPGPSGTPVVNGCVKSVGRNGISLSTLPGFYQQFVQTIPRQHLAQVLAGPERADNIWWWRLRAETGAEGWGNQDDMTPDPGPCAFGGVTVAGAQTPPYPVTILPAVQSVPPTVQATPAQQGTLPQTGDSAGWWFMAGLLAVTMMVVGFARRRLQAQPAARSESREDEETDIKKR